MFLLVISPHFVSLPPLLALRATEVLEIRDRVSMIADDVKMGLNVVVYHPHLVNLYGCEIGDGCKIGAFVEIRRTAKIGRNVKIQAFAFIPEGITLEDGVFVGPHVCFTNDKHPRAINADGSLMNGSDWEIVPTLVKQGASIGANATILCGITIGEHALVGAGSVVTHDVPPYALVMGTPARVVGNVRDRMPGVRDQESGARNEKSVIRSP